MGPWFIEMTAYLILLFSIYIHYYGFFVIASICFILLQANNVLCTFALKRAT